MIGKKGETMAEPLRVLMVDDSEDDVTLMLRALRDGHRTVVSRRVQDAPGMQDALEAHPWDVVLCDSSMPQFGARAALQLLRDRALDTPLIVVSGNTDEKARNAALTSGAKSVVAKRDLTSLRSLIEKVCKKETPLSVADERVTLVPEPSDADDAGLAATPQAGGLPAWSNAPRTGRATILVVEDDDTLRLETCRALERAGHEVFAAKNASEVMRLGRQRLQQVNLVLTEVLLPQVNALELVETMRTAGITPRVIFSASNTDDAIVHYGVIAAGLRFLSKPWSPESVARAVEDALDAS
jgi:CheY-like chemotaxis protein